MNEMNLEYYKIMKYIFIMSETNNKNPEFAKANMQIQN